MPRKSPSQGQEGSHAGETRIKTTGYRAYQCGAAKIQQILRALRQGSNSGCQVAYEEIRTLSTWPKDTVLTVRYRWTTYTQPGLPNNPSLGGRGRKTATIS